MIGRIETYIHSDSVTEAKGGCIFAVGCASEAAAKTDEFKDFCKQIASRVYAVGPTGNLWETFPETFEWKSDLEKQLKEKVFVTAIYVLRLEQ